MDKPVLIDSSVWIAYFRKEEEAFNEVNILADAKRVRLIGLVLAELYQGCKSEKEIGVVRDLADIFPRLDEQTGMWEKAGLLSFKLQKQGRKPGLADCYIAVVAQESGTLIYSYDKHFEELASLYNVELYRPGT